ncbi:MAG: hypothetical protein QOH12_3050, partial [Solirubrobacteraceae bacterium]|nr:hypothetical protein [Solirubrobacteraceae bacterium]
AVGGDAVGVTGVAVVAVMAVVAVVAVMRGSGAGTGRGSEVGGHAPIVGRAGEARVAGRG